MPMQIGGGPKRPQRPPTHKSLSFDKLGKWVAEIEEAATGGVVTAEALADLAADLGTGAENLYAALVTSDLTLAPTGEPIRFEVCAGGCQQWGALSVLEHLLDIRADRLDEDEPTFEVMPKACLDKCGHAAAVVVASPAGRAVIEEATADKINEALEALE